MRISVPWYTGFSAARGGIPSILPVLQKGAALASGSVAIAVSFACPAFAHGSERGFVMLLPTGYYRTGGALAVAASFVTLAIVPAAWFKALTRVELTCARLPCVPRNGASLFSFALLAVLFAAGLFATPDPLENLLPLTIWTVFWVGFTLLQALFGNLWPWLNPWTGPLAALRTMTGSHLARTALVTLPKTAGHLPASLMFLLIAWYELVSLAPDNPPELAVAAAIYWLFNLVAMIVFGQGEWMRRGEALSVFFRFVGMVAPFSGRRRRGRRWLVLTWPGRRSVTGGPLSISATLFVLLTLATVSFDGFSKTFTWLGSMGVNPLEFPGRSAMMTVNMFGLLAAFTALVVVFYLAVYLGNRAAAWPHRAALAASAGLFVVSIIPISIAFHAAHYLTVLLVNGQYFAAAISDPFSLGWNLFGTAHLHPTTSFLTNLERVSILWTVQTVIVVAGHIAGITLAHMVAIEQFGTTKGAVRSQLFLAAGMVFYTVFGLWLLSTPVAG
ncbi:hypothetical protein SAMN02927900_02687 [Rhizobium mongolense subsp. loessense]|uniref:Uncharacterized protein n=1 Tax=Rhizobium mongolense subsp. loessense TaxID=158890 RepID=A0A1G4RHM1_9HYPH|nr:hypothetical protein [Rhizobium mongolense]SCW56328.1 hypothetical protein SAMN02927900_02687 [Rhizobium mongolense subsp. loessense]